MRVKARVLLLCLGAALLFYVSGLWAETIELVTYYPTAAGTAPHTFRGNPPQLTLEAGSASQTASLLFRPQDADGNNVDGAQIVSTEGGAFPPSLGFWVLNDAGIFVEPLRLLGDGGMTLGPGNRSGSPGSGVLRGPGGWGSNVAGGSLTLRGGSSTGTAPGGNLVFETAAAGTAGGTGVNVQTERMRITAAGNVGIGTAAPAGRLHVAGVDDAVSSVVFVAGADTVAAGVPDIRMGVGTAAPVASLHVAGGVYVLGGNGDVNGDGFLTSTDVLAIINHLNALFGTGTFLAQDQLVRADVNGDGRVDSADTQMLISVLNARGAGNTALLTEAERQTYKGRNHMASALTVETDGDLVAFANLSVDDVFLRSRGRWLSTSLQMITGTYTGDGGAGGGRRTIAVPGISAARPIRMLMIFEPDSGGHAAVSIKTESMGAGSDLTYRNADEAKFDDDADGPAIHFEATGFSINRSNNSINRNNDVFHYVALTS